MEPNDEVVVTIVVCGLLRSANIECAYRETQAIDSLLEEFTPAGPREILVRASDLESARELLASVRPADEPDPG